ncbi:MAG TPA: hypothetical protein VFG23_26480 [Polyangia bacterium]|nr:hypothetical protein [Polyangia bacterium]
MIEFQGGGALDGVPVDRFGVAEIVGVHGGNGEDGRAFESDLGAPFGLDAKLLAHQVVEERGGRIIAGDGLAGGGVQDGSGVVEAQSA